MVPAATASISTEDDVGWTDASLATDCLEQGLT